MASVEFAAMEGPIPSAAELARYRDVHPEAPDFIFSEWRNESRHRRSVEKYIVRSEARARDRGQHYGLAVMLAGLVIGGGLVALGHDTAGAVIAGADLTAAAAVFITGRRRED